MVQVALEDNLRPGFSVGLFFFVYKIKGSIERQSGHGTRIKLSFYHYLGDRVGWDGTDY